MSKVGLFGLLSTLETAGNLIAGYGLANGEYVGSGICLSAALWLGIIGVYTLEQFYQERL